MKTSYITNLVLLIIIVALYLLIQQPTDNSNKISTKLSTLSSNSISTITVKKPDYPPIIIQKNDIAWQLTQPVQAQANTTRIELLLSLLHSNSSAQLAITDDVNLATFGLDENSPSIQFDDHLFQFGSVEALTKRRYILHNDVIHLVSEQVAPLLNVGATSFIENRLLSSSNAINKIAMPLLKHDNTLSNTYTTLTLDNGHWTSNELVLTSDQLTTLVDTWQHAYASQVMPSNTDDNHQLQVTIWYQNQAKPTVLSLATMGSNIIIHNTESQLNYHFPISLLTQLFPLMPQEN